MVGSKSIEAPLATDFEASLERKSDQIANRVRESLGCDCSAVTVQAEGKMFSLGIAEAPGVQLLPREHRWEDTVCAKVIQRGGVICVSDAHEEQELRDLVHVKDVGFTGYLGYPIRDSQGQPYGVLCAVTLDRRDWSTADMAIVEAAACEAGSLFAVKQLRNEIAGLYKDLADADRILMTLANSVQTLVSIHDVSGDMLFASSNLRNTYNEKSLVNAVNSALKSDAVKHRVLDNDNTEGDNILRVRDVVVTTPKGGKTAISAQIRRSPANTYYVYWKVGVAQILN